MRRTLIGFVLLVAACGGERSVASKSAAAYDEAKAKGIHVGGGHEHGGHEGGTADMPMDHADMDHADMDHGMAADANPDHSMHSGMPMTGMAMDHDAHGGAMDHSAMDHSAMTHAAMGHDMSAMPAAHDMPGMSAEQHASMQHGATATATPSAAAPISAPSATLQPDAFDAPAPVSVSEAAKAGQGGGHEGHAMRGITPGEDRENPPTPMPAIRDGSNPTPTAPEHKHH